MYKGKEMNRYEMNDYILNLQQKCLDERLKNDLSEMKRKNKQDLFNLQVSLLSMQITNTTRAMLYQALNPNIGIKK